MEEYDLTEYIHVGGKIKGDYMFHDIDADQVDIEQAPWKEGIDIEVGVEHGTIILYFDDPSMRNCLQFELADFMGAIFPASRIGPIPAT